MKRSFYIFNDGNLRRKDNTLTFTTDDNEKRDIPIEQIRDIYVMSEMTFNTALINILSQKGIPIHFFNFYDFYTGSFYPREHLISGNLLVKQVQFYEDEKRRLEIAKSFVEGAACNIYRN